MKDFLEVINQRVKNEDQDHDYLTEAKSIKNDDGRFWYDYSKTLRAIPEYGSLDIRENGSLATALFASQIAFEKAPDAPAAHAERILAHSMLVHGLNATVKLGINPRLSTGITATEWYSDLVSDLRDHLNLACEKFPDDDWFNDQREDFKESFG